MNLSAQELRKLAAPLAMLVALLAAGAGLIYWIEQEQRATRQQLAGAREQRNQARDRVTRIADRARGPPAHRSEPFTSYAVSSAERCRARIYGSVRHAEHAKHADAPGGDCSSATHHYGARGLIHSEVRRHARRDCRAQQAGVSLSGSNACSDAACKSGCIRREEYESAAGRCNVDHSVRIRCCRFGAA